MVAPDRDRMVEEERLLGERFAALRDSRDGPVFFIEHGFSEMELEKLTAAVRETIRHHPPESTWWRAFPLPLIVVATEVGYRYRGTGTDFWPKLESALSIGISLESRQSIRDLFDACSSRYRGARPLATPWAAVFRLIAWPITHALVPREFHRQLAATLANLRANVSVSDAQSLLRAVRTAAGRPSIRFASFLEDERVAASVIRALLGKGNSDISESATTRFSRDLGSDPYARRDMALARAQQQYCSRSVPPVGTVPLPTLEGSLQLRQHVDGNLAIEVMFPAVHSPDAKRLRQSLRVRRFAPRLWDATSAVPSERILSGLPFIVCLTSVPDAGAQLFGELPNLGLDDVLRRVLESFTLDFHRSLLFVENTDGVLARRVHGKEISGHRAYWLLASNPKAELFVGLPSIGTVGPFTCFRLDPSNAPVKAALERLGYRVTHGIAVAFAGTPQLEFSGTVPRFLVGDEIVIVPRREHPAGSGVELDDKRVPLDHGLVRALVPKGKHFLTVSSPESSRRFEFEGVVGAVSSPRDACWIELTAQEITVQALLRGNLALRVDGLAQLEGLALTVELEISGHRVGITQPLGPLPQILFGDHNSWSILLDEAAREQIVRDPNPVLHARVGALAAESWPLAQRLRPCWWTRGPSGFVLENELGPLEHGEVAVDAPTALPVSIPSRETMDARLLSPLDLDEVTFGPTAQFATLCVAPDTLALTAPQMARPRLRRSRKADPNSLGTERLVEAWLRWALADSNSWAAEIRRQQVASELDGWFTEVVCGENWSQRESRVNAILADPWTMLADACRKTGRGLDRYVELSEKEENEVLRLAVAEIRRMHPDLWLRIDLVLDGIDRSRETLLNAGDYKYLDASFEGAYQRLSERLRSAGNWDLAERVSEADPGSAPVQWDAVLEQVNAASELRELGEMLLPTHTAKQLMALDPTLMPIGELGEELQRWAMASRTALAGPVPTEAITKAILALWIAPEVAVDLAWRSALDTLLSERALARGARYLALRARAVRQGGVV